MREKITKNRNTILMVLGVLILVTFNIGMKYLATRPRYKMLPEVRLVNQKKENTKGYAIMVPNDSGDGYIEYTSQDGKWPSKEEGYEFKEAKCIDNEGQLVDNALTFNDGKVELQTDRTIYCTLYFDKNLSVLVTLRKNDPQNKLSSEVVGGMYRYQGKNTDTINNYICFGTDNKEECINESTGYDKYMYRIIGITEEGQLYLIKMKGVETNNSKTFTWNGGPWPDSSVYKDLNGTYSSGNIFINNTRYGYMVEGNDWYSQIESNNWKYGEIKDISNNGIAIYNTENAWSDEVPAKIGLMYLHDYYLAYDNNRNWNSDYDTSNWIHFVNNKNTTGSSQEVLLPIRGRNSSCGQTDEPGITEGPSFSSSDLDDFSIEFLNMMITEHSKNEKSAKLIAYFPQAQAYFIQSSGNVDYDGACGKTASGITRPTFYLSSTVKIKSGTGKIDDPYILNIN